MDNGFLNSLQLYPTQNFSGLVDENMLARALLTKPHETTNMLAYSLRMGHLMRAGQAGNTGMEYGFSYIDLR